MRQSGFSLIDLMITVAIIGVLTAIAVPSFLRYQMRARSTEAATNLKAQGIVGVLWLRPDHGARRGRNLARGRGA